MKPIYERIKALDDYSSKVLDWGAILSQAGVTDVQDLGNQILCSCPMHADDMPSFRVLKDKGYYHCFSCGDGGSALKLMYKTCGTALSKTRFYEQWLKASDVAQDALGFNTLYLGTAVNRVEAGQVPIGMAKFESSFIPMSLVTLAEKVREVDDTWATFVLSTTLLQAGIPTDEVYEQVKGRKTLAESMAEESKISLSDLFSKEDLEFVQDCEV